MWNTHAVNGHQISGFYCIRLLSISKEENMQWEYVVQSSQSSNSNIRIRWKTHRILKVVLVLCIC